MSDWNILPAPKDKIVWLFLPCAKYKTDAQGRPSEVDHEIALAEYDRQAQMWVRYNQQPRVPIYASMWAEAPNPNKPPEMPDLG